MHRNNYELNSSNVYKFRDAIKKNIISTVSEMIENGFDISFKIENDNSNSLHLASFYGYCEIANILIASNPDLLNGEMINGINPLHLASQQGHLDVVKLLLKKNPDLILKKTQNGITPLHLASQQGHLDVVKLLLKKNPDFIDAEIDGTKTALYLAKKHNNIEVVRFLEETKRNNQRFSKLRIKSQDSFFDDPAQIEIVNEQNSSKSESCHDYWKFCKEGQWKELEALIKDNRDIMFNHKYSEASMAMGGSTEKTLFHRMVESGATEALAILKKYSQPSQFNLKCNMGYKIGDEQSEGGEIRGITPLYLAIDKQNKEMVQYLIEYSNIDEIVTKNSKDSDKLVEFSILEIVLKRSGSAEGLEILKIMTGDNLAEKKARFFKYNEGGERRDAEIEKMARNFQKYGAEIKELLEQKYPEEIKIIKEEIEKKSKQPEAQINSPRASDGVGASKLAIYV